MDYRWAPSIDAEPAQLLRISGEKDSALELHFVIRYETTHSECQRTFNWIAGVGKPRWREMRYLVRTALSHYSVTIPLDHFIPGPCQWRPQKITYKVTKGNISNHVSWPEPDLVHFGFRKYPMDRDYPTDMQPIVIECFVVHLAEPGEAELRCSDNQKEKIISPNTKELHVSFQERSGKNS